MSNRTEYGPISLGQSVRTWLHLKVAWCFSSETFISLSYLELEAMPPRSSFGSYLIILICKAFINPLPKDWPFHQKRRAQCVRSDVKKTKQLNINRQTFVVFINRIN
jgi:hypothetical protein